MSNVVDLFSRQAVPLTLRTATELAEYARQVPCPDFVKRRGKMVCTEDTRAAIDELFATFHLRIRSGDDPDLVLNTWAFLAATFATALLNYDEGNFLLVQHTRPMDFCDYVLAVAEHDATRASAAAERFGVLDGVSDDHPIAARMRL